MQKAVFLMICMMLGPLQARFNLSAIPNAIVGVLGRLGVITKPSPQSKRFNIGVVRVYGEISPKNVSTRELWQYGFDPDISGIIIDIDSGGGQTGPAEDFLQALEQVVRIKKVVVCVKSVCASGAYWLAAAADAIVAQPAAIIGSIGAYSEFELDKRVHQVVIASGALKYPKIDPVTGQLDPAYAAHAQQIADGIRRIFCERIAQLRGIPLEQIMAQEADVFLAEEALEKGLIDYVGGFAKAVQVLQQLSDPALTKGITVGEAWLYGLGREPFRVCYGDLEL